MTAVDSAPSRAARKIECNACPVLCQISEGRSGACDRYANVGGELTRVDPVLLLGRQAAAVEFARAAADWDGRLVGSDVFVGSGVLVGGGAVCAAGISRRSACRMTRDK